MVGFKEIMIDFQELRNVLIQKRNICGSVSKLASILKVKSSTLRKFLKENIKRSMIIYVGVQNNCPDTFNALSHPPKFVINTIFHLPSKMKFEFKSQGDCQKEMAWNYTIDTERAGILGGYEVITEKREEGSTEIKEFLAKLKKSAFENENNLKERTSTVILLNRMESVDSRFNEDFEQIPSDARISCSVCKVLWQPVWKNKDGQPAKIKDVRDYYNGMRDENKKKMF